MIILAIPVLTAGGGWGNQIGPMGEKKETP